MDYRNLQHCRKKRSDVVAGSDSHAIRSRYLKSVDRHVLLTGDRIPGDKQSGGDVSASVVFMMGRDGKKPGQINFLIFHFLTWRLPSGNFV